jgi:hypothetical protein
MHRLTTFQMFKMAVFHTVPLDFWDWIACIFIASFSLGVCSCASAWFAVRVLCAHVRVSLPSLFLSVHFSRIQKSVVLPPVIQLTSITHAHTRVSTGHVPAILAHLP